MEKSKKEYKDYEDEIVDVDEIEGTDIKINPDYYIHSALLKAQKALTKDNLKDGFIQFQILVEHIETLCKAANMLSDDYTQHIEEYQKTEECKKSEGMARDIKIANKKVEYLMKEVFASKISTNSLKA